jgi:hypothetical protein
MTYNEMELINMIRNHDDAKRALITATNIIIAYLTLHESCQEQAPACQQGYA